MKQLQNNFTTPEQSKRLLELGVPVSSADLYYFSQDSDIPLIRKGNGVPLCPCWSVGRLMEIFDICDTERCLLRVWDRHFELDIDYVEYVIKIFEIATEKGMLDFSKLEG